MVKEMNTTAGATDAFKPGAQLSIRKHKRVLALLLSSVACVGVSSHAALAYCSISDDGFTAVCDGAINVPYDFQPSTPGNYDDVGLTIQGLPNQVISNTASTAPALGIEFSVPYVKYPGGAYLKFNLDGTNTIPVVSNTASALFSKISGLSGGAGSGSKGSGGHSGSAGGLGAGPTTLLATVNGLAATVNQGAPGVLDNAAISFSGFGGDGGRGGDGTSTGFGDGYGGAGGNGGDGGLFEVNLTDVSVAADRANGALNPQGGIVISGVAGDGGDGGKGQAADYTGGGGNGGVGGEGGAIDFFLTGTLGITSSTVGLSISTQGGNGGNGGEGKNTLTSTARGGQGGEGGFGGNINIDGQSKGIVAIDVQDGPGIFLQSTAGDGGNGGYATGGGSSYGGDGGIGGTGGFIDVNLGAPLATGINVISTTGDSATGLHARSHGGAGGDGGTGNGLHGHGGGTRGSGPARDVTINYVGTITTTGGDSDAIMAHSVGGFAGDAGDAGGFISYGGSAQSNGAAGNVSITYTGGQVTLANGQAVGTGVIQTQGDHSSGIFAQSVGGGGGKAGSGSGLKGVGGTGAAGGDGGTVTIDNKGAPITTKGDFSRGIFAQSTGGGGGDGGNGKGIDAIGGAGSTGGVGGDVSVTNSGLIITSGLDADGIFAQSLGGGGGTAGSASGDTSIGGNGGSGATGGDVTVDSISGLIATAGRDADAIFAQSVGGSGGNGSNTASGGVAFSMSVSGAGGTGNHGGNVTIDQSFSDLETSGDNARGLVVMSVGGGGGNSGNAITGSAFPIDVAVGRAKSGGSGGDGGAVEATHFATITTSGVNATGVLATSVGGGGGSAGTSVAGTLGLIDVSTTVAGAGSLGGDGGDVTVCRAYIVGYGDDCQGDGSGNVSAGALTTTGNNSGGILATSVGGSGGHSGVDIAASAGVGNVNVGVGADGGAGGTGQLVQVYSGGGITTSGDASSAIVSTSIGGSGGASYVTGAASAGSIGDVSVAIGGDGGKAGGSMNAEVTSLDNITTSGDSSNGIVALSQAGSGGLGGVAIGASGLETGSADIAVGGAGGSGGNAGGAYVNWLGSSMTLKGDHSSGILAQASGGSGGVAGYTVSGQAIGMGSVGVSVGDSGGDGGSAGGVSVTAHGGSITTNGTYSTGISSLSLGGHGGRGGTSIAADGLSQMQANVSIGGSGGSGGTSGTAEVHNLGGTVTTNTDHSSGLVAQSIAGNGGQGGMAIEAAIDVQFDGDLPTGSVGVAVGGGGGDGRKAGDAIVENTGAVGTNDFNSTGILAQSQGGSGGQGGNSFTGTANVKSSQTYDVNVAVGGSGGKAGTGGNVTVDNSGSVATAGDNSNAIMGQSLGGDGGDGGSSYNILLNLQSGGQANNHVSVSVGGSGGGGGQAGTVAATNSGAVSTAGTSSSGMYLQSVGGHGGSGGLGGNIMVSLSKKQPNQQPETTSAMQVNVAVGGKGGDGSIGEDVTATNGSDASIATQGATAFGIFAQSIGGNGGDGGSASNFAFVFSGSCKVSANSGDNTCTSAQDQSKTTQWRETVNVAVGQAGGSGNDSGNVTVTNDGVVTTQGENAHAIFAQAVGGGGGTGGSTLKYPVNFESGGTSNQIVDYAKSVNSTVKQIKGVLNTTQTNVFVGGSGGAAGKGGDVNVAVNGTGSFNTAVATQGDNAVAVFAQSVGGSGGSGGGTAQKTANYALRIGSSGAGGGNGGAVNVSGASGGLMSTVGNGAIGVLAQSVGGGGGHAGAHFSLDHVYDVNVQIGGSDGIAGDGGVVKVDLTDENYFIATSGREASAIFAQSVGGGGGTHTGAGDTATGSVQVGMGSTAIAKGNGADVTVDYGGQIVTGQANEAATVSVASHGIFAQSVGGSGGYGGAVLVNTYGQIGSNVNTNTAGATGNGGAVSVTNSGSVTTLGMGSIGIFAQSVGGGGGVNGSATNDGTSGAYLGSFGGSGSAGVVTVTADANIFTQGDYAHGILAQHAGGGGSTSTNLVNTDTVVVNVNADVTTAPFGTAYDAFALLASSTGDYSGNVNVTVGEDGSLAGQVGAFIFAPDHSGNLLTNNGTIQTTQPDNNGSAIIVGGGSLKLTNNGTITGAVLGSISETALADTGTSYPDNLADGRIKLVNNSGATIVAGDKLDTVYVQNYGTLHVNGNGTQGSTEVSGDLINNAGGLVVIDLDTDSGASDLLTVKGDAGLDGDILVQMSGSGQTQSHTYDILTATGTLDSDSVTMRSSPAVTHDLKEVNGNTLQLTTKVDFDNPESHSALERNQADVAVHVDQAYRAGGLHDNVATTLLSDQTIASYSRSLATLGAELDVGDQMADLNAALSFTDSLFSCPNTADAVRFFDDGQCFYFAADGNRFQRDVTTELDGFTERTARLSFGGQMQMDNGLHIGAVLSYDSSDLEAASSASSSDTNRVQLGVSLKRFSGNWEFGGALALGYGSSDLSREVASNTFANGDRDTVSYGAQLRAGYLAEQGDWYLKPLLAVGVSGYNASGYTETGATGAELTVASTSDAFAYLRPELEIGGQFLTANATRIRPTMTLAVTQFIGNADASSVARLASAPTSVAPFEWSAGVDKTHGEVALGVEILSKNNAVFGVQGYGRASENSSSFGVSARLSIAF